MSEANEFRHVLKMVIDEINKDHGDNSKLDGQMVVAYLSDIGPNYIKERKMIRTLYRDGVIEQMWSEIRENRNLQMLVGKYSNLVEEEYSMKTEAAYEYISAIVYAYTGTQSERTTYKEDEEQSPSSQLSQNQIEEYMRKADIAYEEQEYVEALKWYRKAAEQGNADAQFRLGFCYDTSRGVALDRKEAAKWYRKAAEQGNANAQNNLGHMYRFGIGIEQNLEEALKWYRKAAAQGHKLAILYLNEVN